MLNPIKINKIAKACHEVNRAFCISIDDTALPPWEEAPEWQRDSVRNGVEFRLEHIGVSPAVMHINWMQDKLAQGWKYGPVKDVEKKEHPCLVPYNKLPPAQRAKDVLFATVVDALSEEFHG
jgi:hypothetical protein